MIINQLSLLRKKSNDLLNLISIHQAKKLKVKNRMFSTLCHLQVKRVIFLPEDDIHVGLLLTF